MNVSTERSELDVTVTGEGDSVLTIHGAFFGGTFEALRSESPLRDRFKLITYDRHGYAGSSKPETPYSLEDVTADALSVLHHAGEERAHVVAHSAGCIYALQLAMDHPEAVHSVTVIEPVLPTPEWGAFLAEHFVPAGQALANGDPEMALDTSFGPVYGGLDYRTEMNGLMPDGWFERAVGDIRYLFQFESPALRMFEFGPEQSKQIEQPVLVIEGEETQPIWTSIIRHFKTWVPHADHAVIPGGNHMCPVLKPAETARILVPFLESNSIKNFATETG